jgi:signal transduction histidine kinase
LAGFFFLVTGFLTTIWILTTLGATPLDAAMRPRLLASAGAGAVLGTLELGLRSRAARAEGGGRRILFWYGSTILEVGIITTGWLTAGTLLPEQGTLFPGIVGFAALTVISALRLDWRITVFTGMLSALASAAIYLSLQPGPMPPGPRPGLSGSVNALVIIGILAGLVAEQARRRTLHAINAVVARERLEREVMSVAEAERQRVGRDLHDGLGGRFSGLSLLAEGLARRAENGQSAKADELRELASLAGEGAEEARRLARGLDPAPVEAGLLQALTGLAHRTESAGTACTFAFEGNEVALERDTTLHLYHIAQEAVSNAIRHGRPSRVDIRLTVRAGTIALDVRDDGSGIPVEPAEGLGLRTMRKRAALLESVLRVRQGPTGGNVVNCVVPRG